MTIKHPLSSLIQTPYALGTWAFGGSDWGGKQDDAMSLRVLEDLYAYGITHVDTAYDYGCGHSEALCGAFLKNKKDSVFIATKGFIGKSSKGIIKSLERSLGLLGVDKIDLYYIHWPKAKVDMRPHMEALEHAREQGKIRYIGVSNFSVQDMEEILQVGNIDAHQLCYNLLWRKAEDSIIPYCREQKIPVMAYSPLAQGLLTGKFQAKPNFDEGDYRAQTVFYDEPFCADVFSLLCELRHICEHCKVSMFSAAIQWIVRQQGLCDVIVGVRNLEQAKLYKQAIETSIPECAWSEVDTLSNSLLDRYPHHTNIFKYYP